VRPHISRSSIIIAISIAVMTVTVWAFLNQPESEPPWPKKIQGFSFSPYRADQDAMKDEFPTEAQIDEDLALLRTRTHAVRTYTVEGSIGSVPRLARKHGLNVALGAWIDHRLDRNEEELERVIQIAEKNRRSVVRVFVGNEVQLRGEISIAKHIEYLDRVRSALDVRVSTAEPWHVWLRHPELAEHVDFIGVHLLPYWEGLQLDDAIGFVFDKINKLKEAFPDKPIVVSEVGWPSQGRTRGNAVASDANQATFLRRFIDLAEKEKYVYYVMEAFDQPWKMEIEGAVGAYWGVFNADRKPKFEFTAPIVDIPEWPTLAGASVLIGLITLGILFIDSRSLSSHGRGFLALVAYAIAGAAVWVAYDFTRQYLTGGMIVIGVLLFVGMIGVILVILAEAHEWAEATWVSARRRPFHPVPVVDTELPMVSVHVPAYNEPPEMMIETLDALARLEYPRYEVIVIDNNTKDPAVWQPVQAHCEKLGPSFRFFHEDKLAGFKAGALNYALARTDPEAEVVAVIDSDYVVRPRWLRDLVPQFRRKETAIVQAPQDYRDDGESAFKAMCYAEYRGFFYIGMVTRNDRNAIIQHGTMTMVRRSVLEEVGGWAEWCITEDAELGLRVFQEGYEAVYFARSYGQGLMPDTFLDFKKQRFRWAYGAMQILRRHAGALFGRGRHRLSRGQRYHFFAGWLPWLADGFNLVFNFAAIAWTIGMVLFPLSVDPPFLVFSLLPLILFGFKIAKILYLYQTTVDATLRQTAAAALAGLSLSHTISLAILTGLVTRSLPFFRTPKRAESMAILRALGSVREELLLLIALWLGAIGMWIRPDAGTPDVALWSAVLLVQSVPYLASLVVALISAYPKLPASWVGPMGVLDASRLQQGAPS